MSEGLQPSVLRSILNPGGYQPVTGTRKPPTDNLPKVRSILNPIFANHELLMPDNYDPPPHCMTDAELTKAIYDLEAI